LQRLINTAHNFVDPTLLHLTRALIKGLDKIYTHYQFLTYTP